MADLIQAAAEAQKLITMLQGVETIAQAMTQVGSLEQACNEVKTRHGVLTAQAAEAQADLDAKKAAAQTAADASTALAETAKGTANAIVAAARVQAESIIAAATSQAAQITADANKHADAVDDLVAAADKQLDERKVQLAAITAEHDRVSALVAQIKGT